MRVLVCGVTGQDGAYLVQQLLAAGCEVLGTSRSGSAGNLARLAALGLVNRVPLKALDPTDPGSVSGVLDEVRPDAIVNLAGLSSVALSFQQPLEALKGSVDATVNMLEWIRRNAPSTRLIAAGSGDCFGDTTDRPATEGSRFDPRSPYAVGKCAVADLVRLYRHAYGLHAATAFLFNHESPLRSETFVTAKVVAAAIRIRDGRLRGRLELGTLGIVRDWGWASEYMDAIWRMVRQPAPEDLVIATGTSMSLEQFIAAVFDEAGLDWREHVISVAALHRPSDIECSSADPTRAAATIGWQAQTRGEAVPRRLFREAPSATI
jgi:GDPmannose 4,6-dehydratase